MKWFAAVLLLALAQIAQAADAVPTGRIFFTPEQRAQLDLLRTQKAVASKVRDEPIPENVTYNGIVRSSDGKTTVWVNNEALTDAELRVKQSIVGRVDRNGRILLQTPQATGAAQLQLKVGQSAELLSGKIDEPYAAQRAAPAGKLKTESKSPTAPAAEPSVRTPAAERDSAELVRPADRETTPLRERPGDAPAK